MGVVLIDGVVGVEQGSTCPLRDMAGRREGAEFTVGVDDVRSPGQKLPHHPFLQGNTQPRVGVYRARSHGAQIIDAVPHVGGRGAGESQNTDLMSAALQPSAQIQHGSHNSIYRRREPIGCQQYFHR